MKRCPQKGSRPCYGPGEGITALVTHRPLIGQQTKVSDGKKAAQCYTWTMNSRGGPSHSTATVVIEVGWVSELAVSTRNRQPCVHGQAAHRHRGVTPFLSFLVELTPALWISGPLLAPWFLKFVWIFSVSKVGSSADGCSGRASCQKPCVCDEMDLCCVGALRAGVSQAVP